MDILLGFAPFLVYAIVQRLASPPTALWSAAATSAALLAHSAIVRHRAVKILEAGTLLLFGGLGAYAFLFGTHWSIPAIRVRVDIGLLLIVLISIAVRRPFTLQYAREQVPPELWKSPLFLRTNYIITAIWAAAFVVMLAADLAMLYFPDLSLAWSILATIVAFVGAVSFTSRYPQRVRARAARTPPP